MISNILCCLTEFWGGERSRVNSKNSPSYECSVPVLSPTQEAPTPGNTSHLVTRAKFFPSSVSRRKPSAAFLSNSLSLDIDDRDALEFFTSEDFAEDERYRPEPIPPPRPHPNNIMYPNYPMPPVPRMHANNPLFNNPIPSGPSFQLPMHHPHYSPHQHQGGIQTTGVVNPIQQRLGSGSNSVNDNPFESNAFNRNQPHAALPFPPPFNNAHNNMPQPTGPHPVVPPPPGPLFPYKRNNIPPYNIPLPHPNSGNSFMTLTCGTFHAAPQ